MNRHLLLQAALWLTLMLPVQVAAQSGPAQPAAAAPDWKGKYSGSNLVLELGPTPFGGLTGMLTFEGSMYIATARADGDRLTGTFMTGTGNFPYEATRSGSEVRLVTGGTEYVLRREGATVSAPANPLARRGPTAAPSQGSPVTAAVQALLQPPPDGQVVQSSLGYTFRIPPGWTSTETPEGVMLLPGGVTFNPNRNDNPEVYLGLLRSDYDAAGEAQAVRQLSAGFARNGGAGGQRQATTFGTRQGAIYRWELRDPQGRISAFDVFLVPEGRRAFILIAAGEKARVRAQDASVRQIVSTVAFTAPRLEAGGPLADSTPLAQRWLARLRGKAVRQFWASQGMSSEKKHWLNADGTYAYNSSSMVSIDVAGASALSTGGDDSRGRWRIRDLGGEVFLEVTYNNGTVSRMPITEVSPNWLLNGEKAFIVDL
jgi:hypothetical protein